ncbi:MAG: type IVB secretion system protein IcmH/DotU [Paracoccaceae bacterium]
MSDKDDPFGLSNDAGRTRIRPQRGGQTGGTTGPGLPGAGQAGIGGSFGGSPAGGYGQAGYTQAGYAQGGARSAYPSGAPTQRVRHTRLHGNPLVAAFSALLELAPELERTAPPGQPETLRVRLHDNLIDARDAAVGMGIALTRADQAAWFVAALIDDLAMNTPWGGHSDWPSRPLVVELSGDVDSGTKFFDRVDELLRHLNRDPQMLELAYYCLGLGFRGKFRPQPGGGEGPLMALRSQIMRALRNPETDRAELSPNWRGVAAPDEPRRFAVPIWTIALAALAIVAGVYTFLGLQLSAKAEQLYTAAAGLPPKDRAGIVRPERETVAPEVTMPEIKIEPVMVELLPAFAAGIPPDLVSFVQAREDVSLAFLVLQGVDPELFRSAKADVNEKYLPLVTAIAKVIVENGDTIPRVTVIGHTDSVPVQKSNPFQSNQGLSEARAAAIASLLATAGVPPEKIRSEGRADTEPVADNATKAGKAQNRRVEIKIEKSFAP